MDLKYFSLNNQQKQSILIIINNNVNNATLEKGDIWMGNIYLPKLVSQKYDEAMDYHITMYDNLPYKRDSDFCGIQQVSLYSGHIIKYYLCLNHEDAYEVGNHDDEIEDILAAVQGKEAKRAAVPARKPAKSKREEQGITQEELLS